MSKKVFALSPQVWAQNGSRGCGACKYLDPNNNEPMLKTSFFRKVKKIAGNIVGIPTTGFHVSRIFGSKYIHLSELSKLCSVVSNATHGYSALYYDKEVNNLWFRKTDKIIDSGCTIFKKGETRIRILSHFHFSRWRTIHPRRCCDVR